MELVHDSLAFYGWCLVDIGRGRRRGGQKMLFSLVFLHDSSGFGALLYFVMCLPLPLVPLLWFLFHLFFFFFL